MTKYHTVRLSIQEIRRRWPARDPVAAAFNGFDRLAAMKDGWCLGMSMSDVTKQFPCIDPCPLCAGTTRPADKCP